MILNASNDVFYQKLVDQMNSKKALKQIQSTLDYWVNEENSIEKFQLVKALLEGINWKGLFDKKNQKEG